MFEICFVTFLFVTFLVNILFPTELHLKNVNYLYSACSNPTDVVKVIVLVITHRSNLAVPRSSILVYNHTQDNFSNSHFSQICNENFILTVSRDFFLKNIKLLISIINDRMLDFKSQNF